MSGAAALAKRDVLCYLRDRGAVAGSLMAAMIAIALYFLFLKDILTDADVGGAGGLMDAWVLSGVLGIVPVTVAGGSLQTMVEDRSSGRERDLLVAPVGAASVAWGHILGTFAVSLLLSALAYAVSAAYLLSTGCPLTAAGLAGGLALLVPSALSGSVIVYALASFVRSTAAFTAFNLVAGVLIGFLTGVYMPMGMLAGPVRAVGAMLPATHMASLFRQALCGGALGESFAGAPPDVLEGFRVEQGIDLSVGGAVLPPEASLLFVAAATLAFFAVAVASVRRRSKG